MGKKQVFQALKLGWFKQTHEQIAEIAALHKLISAWCRVKRKTNL